MTKSNDTNLSGFGFRVEYSHAYKAFMATCAQFPDVFATDETPSGALGKCKELVRKKLKEPRRGNA